MATRLSLAQLIASSVPVFESHPKADKAFATADDNIFLSENHARNHARQEKLEVHTITRAEALNIEPANEADEDHDEDEDHDTNKDH